MTVKCIWAATHLNGSSVASSRQDSQYQRRVTIQRIALLKIPLDLYPFPEGPIQVDIRSRHFYPIFSFSVTRQAWDRKSSWEVKHPDGFFKTPENGENLGFPHLHLNPNQTELSVKSQDLGTMEFEMNSMKKCSVQHKAELKHLGTVVINDLKNLKVCAKNIKICRNRNMSEHNKVNPSWLPFSGRVKFTSVLDQERAGAWNANSFHHQSK